MALTPNKPTDKSTTPTVTALNSIDFKDLIGGPLNATAKANEQMAITQTAFISEMGLGNNLAVNEQLELDSEVED